MHLPSHFYREQIEECVLSHIFNVLPFSWILIIPKTTSLQSIHLSRMDLNYVQHSLFLKSFLVRRMYRQLNYEQIHYCLPPPPFNPLTGEETRRKKVSCNRKNRTNEAYVVFIKSVTHETAYHHGSYLFYLEENFLMEIVT